MVKFATETEDATENCRNLRDCCPKRLGGKARHIAYSRKKAGIKGSPASDRKNCHSGQWDWGCCPEKGLGSRAGGSGIKEEQSTGSLQAPGTENWRRNGIALKNNSGVKDCECFTFNKEES